MILVGVRLIPNTSMVRGTLVESECSNNERNKLKQTETPEKTPQLNRHIPNLVSLGASRVRFLTLETRALGGKWLREITAQRKRTVHRRESLFSLAVARGRHRPPHDRRRPT